MEDREGAVRLLVRKKRRVPLDGQLKTAACTIVRNNRLLASWRFPRPNADLDRIGRGIARWKCLVKRLIELVVIVLGVCVRHISRSAMKPPVAPLTLSLLLRRRRGDS